jgi:hypothetical protein
MEIIRAQSTLTYAEHYAERLLFVNLNRLLYGLLIGVTNYKFSFTVDLSNTNSSLVEVTSI